MNICAAFITVEENGRKFDGACQGFVHGISLGDVLGNLVVGGENLFQHLSCSCVLALALTGALFLDIFSKQLRNTIRNVGLEFRVQYAACAAGKTRVNFANESVTADEESSTLSATV